MPLGVQVGSREAPPSRGAETNTSVLHAVGLSTTGPTDAASSKLRSLADWKAVYATGGRAAGNQLAWDCVDAFFRSGGKSMYFSRAVDDTTYDDAAAFLPDEPGQVALWDPTPEAAHWTILSNHAQAFNKRALYDHPNDATADTVAELVTLGATLPQNHYGAGFGPWMNIPGTGGSTRTVPASAIIAGTIARADATGNPNRAAAGRRLGLGYVDSLVKTYTMDDVNTLNAAGWNSSVLLYGVLENYGFDTPVGADDDVFGQFNCSRAEMYIIAQAKAIGENYTFENIDGEGHIASDLASDLEAMLLGLWRVGGLFGATPQEAFAVDVVSVNTPETANEGRLVATISAKLSKHAREVDIELVFVPVNSTV